MSGDFSGRLAPGLERSCNEATADWIRHDEAVAGVALLEAWFQGAAYRPHRHDTYAIGVTETGVQAFRYRGASRISSPGEVVILHPDEAHDGYAGADGGFGYRLLYVEPALILDAARVVTGHRATLPFARQPVVSSPALAAAIRTAFRHGREPLAVDDLILRLTEGLLAVDTSRRLGPPPRHLDAVAIERARQFLAAERTRVVRSWELEAVSGLSRYELARQFRAMLGTSPYRYSLMRRLDHARALLPHQRPLVDVALEAGFADQAHFTRHFTAAYGLPPARYRQLRVETG